MRIEALAVLVITALAAAVPVRAAEDEEKHFTWHPGMAVTLVADDEPRLENGGDGALAGWLEPSVELGYRRESFELGSELGADLRGYIGEASVSKAFWRASGWGEAGILPGLTLKVSDGWLPRPARVWDPPDETENLEQTNQLDVEVRYWRELVHRREVLFSLRGTHFSGEDFGATLFTDGGGVRYDANFNPQHWQGAALVELQSPMGERSAAYLRGRARYRTYEASTVPDQADITAMLGVRSRRFEHIDIDVAAGWGMIWFQNRDNVHRFVGEASLRYRLPNGWTWVLSAANRFVADMSGNNFVESTGRTGIERYLDPLTRISLAGFISRLENDAWETDKNWFGGAEASIRREIGSHTHVSLTYRYWKNGGDFSADDFDQNRITLELSYRR